MAEEHPLITPFSASTVHCCSKVKFLSALNTTERGLTHQRSKEVRQKNGTNHIPPPFSIPEFLCCLGPCIALNRKFQMFHRCAPDFANVKRSGTLINIDAESVVLGDYIVVRKGDRVPADFRVFKVI